LVFPLLRYGCLVDFSWDNLLIILASTILFIIELILATGGEMLKD